MGYKARTTSKTNDYGADIVLNKNGSTIVVQAKRWDSKVGIEAVQQIIGAKGYYKANTCKVVTNNYFTANAKNLAVSSNVELWDRTKLLEIMSKSNGSNIAKDITKEVNLNKRCPKCGSELIMKNGKYGDFLGCINYPKCKYTRNINK